MEYLFTYGSLKKSENNEFSNYLENNSLYLDEGFMYGKLYNIDGYPSVINSNSHNRVSGMIYGLKKIDFEYLDNYEGYNYERKVIPIHTENSVIHCWVYLLKKI